MRKRDSYRVTRTRTTEEHQDVELVRRTNEPVEVTAERVLAKARCIYKELEEEVEAAQRSFKKARGVFELKWGTRLLGEAPKED